MTLPYRTPVARICESCQQPFSARLGKVQAGLGRYCSQRCSSRAIMQRRRAGCDFRGPNNPNYKGGRSQNKRAYVNRYRERYPLHAAANDAVRNALAAGRLIRPRACEHCQQPSGEPLHGHHGDYAQPLNVTWLCRACHRSVHGQTVKKSDLDFFMTHGRVPGVALRGVA